MDTAIRHQRIQSGDVPLHVAVAGNGPPVILLHEPQLPPNFQLSIYFQRLIAASRNT